MNATKKMTVAVNLQVEILPDGKHEFLMTTKEVAKGYDVAVETLRGHKHTYKDELLEGVHFIKKEQIPSVRFSNGGTLSSTYIFWTKQGVIRLGFFIKSERAKLFRDWVENLVLNYIDEQQVSLPAAPKRNHNRLSQDRLLDIMNDICLIENNELRIRLANKIMGKE